MNSSAITLENVSINYNDKLVLDNLNIHIPNEKITVIMGPSGIGKTTLLKVLSQQKKPTQGEIFVHNENIKSINTAEKQKMYRKMGFLFQNSALILNLNIFENIALPLRYHYNLPEDLLIKIVKMKLHAVNLQNTEHLYPEQLSGGMLRRAAIARCIALDPNLIFCDEPFSGQDPINAHIISNLIKKMNQYLKATTVIVSHEINLSFDLADYIYIINDTKIVAQGTPEEICQKKSDFLNSFIEKSVLEFYQKRN